MRSGQKERIWFPYHIVTPILWGVLYFWSELQSLYTWMKQASWSSIPVVPISFTILFITLAIISHRLYYHQRGRKELRVVQVIPSTKLTITAKQVDAFTLDLHQRHRTFWQRLIRGREWFGFIIYTNAKNQIIFYILYPQDKQNGVRRTIKSHFPPCQLRDLSLSQMPLPDPTLPFGGGHFFINRRGKRAGLPLQRIEESQLGSILHHMAPQTWLWIRMSPNLTNQKLERRVQRGLKNLGLSKNELEALGHLNNPTREIREMTPMERARYHSLYRQHTGREKSFQVAMSLWVQRPDHDTDVYVQDTKASIERVMEGDNYVFMQKKWLFTKWLHPLISYQPIPRRRHQMTWSHTELGNLLHFPDGKETIYQAPDQPHDRPSIQTQLLNKHEFTQGIKVGTLADDPTREVRIPYHQWTYMAFGAGATGFGKSALFLTMMQSLLDSWYIHPDTPGFTYIDPKGDNALKLLSKIRNDLHCLAAQGIDIEPLKRRIHYFDLASDRFVLGLNLLHRDRTEKPDDIVHDVMALLKNAYPQESIWLDKLGQMAIHALLLDNRAHSILGMEQLLRKDPTFRNQVLPAIRGTIYEQDWIENLEAIQQGHVGLPLLNRMQKIRLNTRMRRLFGQQQMDLKPAEWMDDSHICIFNVSGLTEEERKLAVGYIVTRYHLDAHKRTHQSKIHPHFVDEFSLIQLPVVERIYALDRYTGHCLIPMAQHVGQLTKEIHHAIDGNAATLIAFSQGSQSAKAMSEMSGQQLDKEVLQRLPKRTAWISTRDLQGERISFPIRIEPPYLYDEQGNATYFGPDEERQKQEEQQAYAVAEQFGQVLMQRDCTPAQEVDRWIEGYVMQEEQKYPDQEDEGNGGKTPVF